MEVTQHSKYLCEFCGKYAVKKKAVGDVRAVGK
ncbi:Ribosomal protein L37ae [Corchorus capsularis]|uniref:Ribosomal protein L37ae n=1 Tax=Corchorus capsularis TaxID=210143 RepID=A0A1R3IV43_COCAP|nr:Ribosomal protein L37ae [Corchorus capsularis]